MSTYTPRGQASDPRPHDAVLKGRDTALTGGDATLRSDYAAIKVRMKLLEDRMLPSDFMTPRRLQARTQGGGAVAEAPAYENGAFGR